MRRIHKGREPRSLATYRRGGGTYENFNAGDDVRRALLTEQGSICCYCMQRISIRAMRIEHWASQSGYETRTVDYDNLLGACCGGENLLPADKLHCDVHRKNVPLHINPTQPPPTCEQLLRYLPNGEITAEDDTIETDVVETLNLNTKHLVDARKQLGDQLRSTLVREVKDGQWPAELLQAHIARWQSRDREGHYREFCQVVIYYLEKKLKKKA